MDFLHKKGRSTALTNNLGYALQNPKNHSALQSLPKQKWKEEKFWNTKQTKSSVIVFWLLNKWGGANDWTGLHVTVVGLKYKAYMHSIQRRLYYHNSIIIMWHVTNYLRRIFIRNYLIILFFNLLSITARMKIVSWNKCVNKVEREIYYFCKITCSESNVTFDNLLHRIYHISCFSIFTMYTEKLFEEKKQVLLFSWS